MLDRWPETLTLIKKTKSIMSVSLQSKDDFASPQEIARNRWIEAAQRVFEIEAAAIQQMKGRVSESFLAAVDCLLQSQGKVVVVGIGKSGLVAQKIAATFCSIGIKSVFLHAAEALHGDLGIYSPGDPSILISKSGSTAELLKLIPVLKEFHSPLIGILGNVDSPIAHQVDYVLDASVTAEADPLGIVPTSSALLAMAVGDALASTLILARDFKANDFARYHPAGQLGRSLTLKVRDVMHALDAVAVIKEETLLRDIVIALSEYPLGAACVLSGKGELLGLITDGDIRRALKNHEAIHLLKASDIMSTGPTCTFPEIILVEAVKQMEDRPRQITVLPVVCPQTQQCLGLLRLHDAYQPHLL